MMPIDLTEDVQFVLTDGHEGSGFTMWQGALVPVDVAYRAAVEFLADPVIPPSVHWTEL
jgi:hypothetical protein